jgi:rhamnogalacturonyl hydrolase YesR
VLRTLAALAALVSSLAAEPIGITRKGTRIDAHVSASDLDYSSPKTRILLVGGLDGAKDSAGTVEAAVRWFEKGPAKWRSRYAISAVPLANPDAAPPGAFPPRGEAYASAPEAHALWRFTGLHAPDLVVEVRTGGALRIVREVPDGPGFAAQAARVPVAGTGVIPSAQVTVPAGGRFLPALLAALEKSGFRGPSPARREIQERVARTPQQVARELAGIYGHELAEVVYIPAMAVIGRVRLGEVAAAEQLAEPYVSGDKAPLPEKLTASHFSGHLLFGELASVTGNRRYAELVRAAADHAFAADGTPLPAMPLHNEMSDGVFMGCPILAQAGRLTGQRRYYDQCVRNMEFIRKLDLRPDGLYRHSPLNDAAWGRGNAFPALGLALSLGDLPEWHPGRAAMLKAFREHMETLLAYQDWRGMWHQVVDEPASYRELSATCMIAFALSRGVKSGWVSREKFGPAIDRAWYAIRARVAPSGELVDVCTGTGKQKSLRDYLDRPAILGRDPRGGAMALLIATELASGGAAK